MKIRQILIITGLLFLLFSCKKGETQQRTRAVEITKQENEITITAVKYGTSLFPASAIFLDDTTDRYLEFHWLFYIISLNEHIILIDTGFNDENKKLQFNVETEDPIDLLFRLELNPEDVTDIIITHEHFDHIGNLHRFPYAHVYIHRDSYNTFLENPNTEGVTTVLTNRSRTTLFDDKLILLNCITVKHIGGHTKGSSVVSLDTLSDIYLFTGDEIYLLDNFFKKIPNGSVFNAESNMQFIESIPTNIIILPFHDPGIVPEGVFFKIIYKSSNPSLYSN